ncbi:MAG: co-chaperone GroES [Phycisphaerales bacterium]|nr:co-chaperone GroES [Phycisphaerales bacterium]
MATKTKSRVAIRPLHDKILVERDEAESVTAAGIFIPDSSTAEKPQFATVIAVGDGTLNDAGERIALDVNAGDRVILSKWGGTDIKLDGQDYLIINASDVLAVVE